MVIYGQEIVPIPKGYLYFAIAFSLSVEFLDMRMKENRKRKLEKAGKSEEDSV